MSHLGFCKQALHKASSHVWSPAAFIQHHRSDWTLIQQEVTKIQLLLPRAHLSVCVQKKYVHRVTVRALVEK